MMKRLIPILAASLLAACGSDDLDGNKPAEAGDENVDYCEVYGWYGDGHCDAFCPLPDSDCDPANNVTPPGGEEPPENNAPSPSPDPDPQPPNPDPQPDPDPDPDPTDPADPPGDQCTALPVCGSGTVAVDPMTCLAADDECESRELCGVWAHCLAAPDICPDVEGSPASCPDGMVQVDSCLSEECVIARGTGSSCGDFVFCEAETQCLGLATCAEGQVNVSTETCFALGGQCETTTYCGQTLHCVDIPEICNSAEGFPPSCPAGTDPASSCFTSELNDGTCSLHWGSDDQCFTYTYCR